LKNEATKALVQFGSTYVCEATFSCMVYTKSKYRNRLTDAHLQDNLIIATTTYEPRFRKLPLWATHAPFLPDWLECRLGLSFVRFFQIISVLLCFIFASGLKFQLWVRFIHNCVFC